MRVSRPRQTRVLLRENPPFGGPILNTVLSVPFAEPRLQKLVQVWNYHAHRVPLLHFASRVQTRDRAHSVPVP